jgi:hypothetical protein
MDGNYRALVAYGEIDPASRTRRRCSPPVRTAARWIRGPRLAVPGDIAGGRYVSNVNRVFLEKPPL